MLSTRFTDLVGCTVPIQQAGMGFYAYPPLASAVAAVGGLGMVSVYGEYGGPPEQIAKLLDTVQDIPHDAKRVSQWGEKDPDRR